MILDRWIEHFQPMHRYLEELADLSNAYWREGGLIWSVNFGFRQQHLAKLDGEYVSRHKSFDAPPDVKGYRDDWAALISRALGRWDCPPDKSDVKNAERVVDWYASAPAEKRFMHFQDSDDSMSCETVLLAGGHALAHRIFWSVD